MIFTRFLLKRYEHLLKKINVDRLKIFIRKDFNLKTFLKKIGEDLPKNEISCGSQTPSKWAKN